MPTKKATASLTMDDLLTEVPPKPLASGDIVEAKVLSATKSEIWLDLGLQGTGRVGRREINPGFEVKSGETVSASVVEPDTDWGFTIMSLKKVAKEKGWDYLSQVMDSGEIITVFPYDANRGGLLVELEGIRGFLPVSQLTAQHYPRVSNADKDEILQRLNELKGKPLRVRIININREENKLIVSEKEALREDTKAKLAKLKIGDVVDGEVTGSVDFGIFVTVDGIEGLVHISEISWDRVTNPSDHVKAGEKIKAKVIAIDDDKLSLSIKQLTEDPWLAQIEEFKVGDKVKGTITRITPFGAFIQITPAIEALVHVSEFGDDKVEAKANFAVGDQHEFRVIDIDKEARKISLSMKPEGEAKAAPKAKAETAKGKEEKE
jgi:small subunit ribosomal protein S1